MAILDDNDPVSVLSTKIIHSLDKQEGGLAIAALASVLGSLIDYAHTKASQPLSPSWTQLHEHLTILVADYIRVRERDKRARS